MIDSYLNQITAFQKEHSEKGYNVSTGIDNEDYRLLYDYIIEHKPKHIVEYGSGYSTWFLYNVINDLNLNTKLTSYENDTVFYNYIIDNFSFLKNTVNLVDIGCVDTVVCKHRVLAQEYTSCRFLHSYKDIEEVDFVIIDGPGYSGSPYCNCEITLNWEDLSKHFKRDIKCWIDGRNCCRDYYKEIGYSKLMIG